MYHQLLVSVVGVCRACPINLMPMLIDDAVLNNKIEKAESYYALSCIE